MTTENGEAAAVTGELLKYGCCLFIEWLYNIFNVCMKTESDSSLNALIVGINAKPQGHWFVKCAWANVCKILIEKVSVMIMNKNLESSESLLSLLIYTIWNCTAECTMSTIWWKWNRKLNESIITEVGVTQYCIMSVWIKV